jgi:rRNA maturation endonuclease Nob1
MGTNQDEKNWEYACQNCGAPYPSKPTFCYNCGRDTVVPIDLVKITTDESTESHK